MARVLADMINGEIIEGYTVYTMDRAIEEHRVILTDGFVIDLDCINTLKIY